MIDITINGKSYKVRTTWSEVSAEKLLSCSDSRSEILATSNISADIIYKARTDQLFPIYTLISFLHDIGNYPLAADTKQIEFEDYDHLVQVSQVINERVNNPYQRSIRAAKVYYPDETDTLRLVSLGSSIVLQFHTFMSSYEELSKGANTKDSTDWLERLQSMGAWGIAYVLAGRDITKMSAIFKMPAIQVYTAILYNFRESEHQKEILKRQQTPKTS